MLIYRQQPEQSFEAALAADLQQRNCMAIYMAAIVFSSPVIQTVSGIVRR